MNLYLFQFIELERTNSIEIRDFIVGLFNPHFQIIIMNPNIVLDSYLNWRFPSFCHDRTMCQKLVRNDFSRIYYLEYSKAKILDSHDVVEKEDRLLDETYSRSCKE